MLFHKPPDVEDMNAYYGRLSDTTRWPTFLLPLSSGAQVVVIFRNREGDAGTDFVLRSADRSNALCWVRLDGHFLAPGLSWPELVDISSRPGSGEGVIEHHARVLLLLPATGDADPPTSALPALASALTAAGATKDAATPLACELLNHPLGGTAHWRQDGDAVMFCDALNSRRNPAGLAALSPSETLFLSEALRS
ncbi:hypothetical protein F8568_038070 [Actinomadura sp. LD22]|uniref:Uncharacterized protein n=1 Tax=Actinomadura physcomitrii TaxID=2650748 RepID=A0A6I4MM85_9ACTN|nr:hypothetical protein [Actinomadura physcomitrii]MWA06060.1 hypothetical protein [Actinomadura physcomitrii]